MDNGNCVDSRVRTSLLYSRALTRVLSCLFVFGAATPFALMQSVTLRSERMKIALNVWQT